MPLQKMTRPQLALAAVLPCFQSLSVDFPMHLCPLKHPPDIYIFRVRREKYLVDFDVFVISAFADFVNDFSIFVTLQGVFQEIEASVVRHISSIVIELSAAIR